MNPALAAAGNVSLPTTLNVDLHDVASGSMGGLFHRKRRRLDAHLPERSLAAGADVLPDAVIGDFGHEVPAAGAFGAARGQDSHTEFANGVIEANCPAVCASGKGCSEHLGHLGLCRVNDLDSGNVEELLERLLVALQKCQWFAPSGYLQIRFETFADKLHLTGPFETAERLVANLEETFPLLE